MIRKRKLAATILFLIAPGATLIACGGKAVIDGDGAGGAANTVASVGMAVSTTVGPSSTTDSSSTGMVEGVTLTLSKREPGQA